MKKFFMIFTLILAGLLLYSLKSYAEVSQISYSERFINNLAKCTPCSESIQMKTPYVRTINGQKESNGYLYYQITFSIFGKKDGKCQFSTFQKITPTPYGDEYKLLNLLSTSRILCSLTPEQQVSMAEKLKQYNLLDDRTQLSTDKEVCTIYIFKDNKWIDLEKFMDMTQGNK